MGFARPTDGTIVAAIPGAERLVYEGRGQDLKITMTADRTRPWKHDELMALVAAGRGGK